MPNEHDISVFLVGLERGLFPRESAELDIDELEEERRLCYVAMTRARRRLVITHADQRLVFGEIRAQRPSLFVGELPADHVTREGLQPQPRPQASAVRESSRDAVSSFFGTTVEPEDVSQEVHDDEPSWSVDEVAPAPPRSGGSAGSAPSQWARQQRATLRAGEPSRPVAKGDRVKHPSFGIGKVLKLEGPEGNRMLTVYFEIKAKTVRLVEQFAKLEVL